MSRRGRRGHKGGGHAEEGHADERWLVSYADMITVLMCLFLVLFAMSTIDAEKYAQLRDSLATGFGTTPSTNVDAAVGVIVEPQYVSKDGIGFTSDVTDESSLEEAKNEVAEYEQVMAAITASLAAQGMADQVEFSIDQRGLTIKLVGGQAFFGPDSAVLQDPALTAIDSVGTVLGTLPNDISVEGHIDPYGQGSPALNDWELAAARSTAVLRHLVETGQIGGGRISAVSYGGARPEIGEASELNRRVDIVVLTDLPAAAAAKLPEVASTQKH